MHAHVEIKVDGKWLHYSNPIIDRDYDLFCFIAGVRPRDNENVVPISKDRGLPCDISEVTKLCHGYEGGHNEGWLSNEELAKVEKWMFDRMDKNSFNMHYYAPFGYITGNKVGGVSKSSTGSPEEFQEARLVFWFDN